MTFALEALAFFVLFVAVAVAVAVPVVVDVVAVAAVAAVAAAAAGAAVGAAAVAVDIAGAAGVHMLDNYIAGFGVAAYRGNGSIAMVSVSSKTPV